MLEQEQLLEAESGLETKPHKEVASTAAHINEAITDENLELGKYRFQAAADPVSKKFEMKARIVRAEVTKLPIFNEFVRYSMRGDGKRQPLMAQK